MNALAAVGRGGAAGLLAFCLLGAAGCRREGGCLEGPAVAVTTSYLEAATREILGDGVRVLRLAEAGTCPGHFDIRPSQVVELRNCRVLVRFDFQRALDGKFGGVEVEGPRVAEIVVRGGMCRPESYRAACVQTAEAYVALGLISRAEAESRLGGMTERVAALSKAVTNRVARAGWVGQPVIASGHQRDFCEWLGLRVVGEFRAADTAGVAEIERAIAAGDHEGVRWVIANQPEGRRTADALGGRLKARVVAFENFPRLVGGEAPFDAMLRRNVALLLEAAQ